MIAFEDTVLYTRLHTLSALGSAAAASGEVNRLFTTPRSFLPFSERCFYLPNVSKTSNRLLNLVE